MTQDPLDYSNVNSSYVPPKSPNTTTLLEFIKSRPDLSKLSEALDKVGGFPEVFDTDPAWKFTFFAPNNDAFEKNVGRYFNTFEATPKGKWWLGNSILHHYVPNSSLKSTDFNETYRQFQVISLIPLSHQHKYPLLTLLRLFIPYPSWFFPIPGPFSLRALIEDTKNETGIITSHFGDIHNLRAIPIWRMRDTPLRSIYRLYELHLADHYELVGWETEYFFCRRDWKLRDIPDPKDPDPLRSAIVASIVEELH
ncbi:uncharacterized protein CDV56_106954 [Aspergillus thermomutatus]|uniref:FAS1 domain-containing protein n=1 Tax=Aspergillus thermomutatus TaxID=41047 RepID=A0A397H411_ASPTH|nr:uncharacterized protein CDV56_106954 [Aspergillus thermomutatus]RHZ57489.1 hypothetical protein CDV56_106954 [Aspergillus thermomutatus]